MVLTVIRSVVAGAALVLLMACGSLVDVDTPGVILGDELDPVRDSRIFSLSARQNFADAYAQFILYGAWFSGEAISAETMPAVAEFDRRAVSADNPELSSAWRAVSIARETAERVVVGLRNARTPTASADLARAALFAGYSYVVMAEYFCEGRGNGGPLLGQSTMLERAVAHFSIARNAGQAALTSTADSSEARAIIHASHVGTARALLQNGDGSGARAAAANVPATFSMEMLYSDAIEHRGRLANALWHATAVRGTLSIAPAFRSLNDPRVPVASPAPELPPFDGVTALWTQRKYSSFGTPIRLASALESRYIDAEASGLDAMLALIQARRQANGQSPYTGPTDTTAIVLEFMDQRGRDFFLEGKRVGDNRRQPGRIPGLRVAGSVYHKPGFAPVGDQSCWPLPTVEAR